MYSKEFGCDLVDRKDLLKARDLDSLNSKSGNGHGATRDICGFPGRIPLGDCWVQAIIKNYLEIALKFLAWKNRQMVS